MVWFSVRDIKSGRFFTDRISMHTKLTAKVLRHNLIDCSKTELIPAAECCANVTSVQWN